MISETRPGTIAAIVTYHPERQRLNDCISAALEQASEVLIVANDGVEPEARKLTADDRAEVVISAENRGLGWAYNLAAGRCSERGAAYLLLLDQDTILSPGSLALLVKTLDSSPRHVAAAGARPIDQRAARSAPSGLTQSSGTLFRVESFDMVGGFDEDLFIHHVDQEWFFRASAAGLSCLLVADATTDHRSGDEVYGLLGRDVRLYSTTRLYYAVRNTLFLARRSYIPLRWRVTELLKVAVKVILSITTKHASARGVIGATLRGLRDGVRR